MTHSLMIVQPGVLPTLLEFPTHKAAEIPARELRVKSDSLQIINNSSGKVTNFSAVLEAEARAEEELSAARRRAHIDSLPESEIRRIYAQHKEELDRREERRRANGWCSFHYSTGVPTLHYAVKHRMDEIEKHDKLERQWTEAMEELCGIHKEPVSACAPVQECGTPFYAPFRSRGEKDIDSPFVHFLCWGGLMLIVVAAVYAAG